MPGRELEGRTDTSAFPKSKSLKAHKALPRRRVFSDNSDHPHEDSIRKRFTEGEVASVDFSWASESPQSRTEPIPRLPLTPPPTGQEVEIQVHFNDDTSNPASIIPTRRSSELSTPVNPYSPPTPEDTPPRRHIRPPHLAPSPLSARSSSRAESFKTAREELSSDDEGDLRGDSPVLPRMNFASRWDRSEATGLGLAWDLEDSDRTPTARTPNALSSGVDREVTESQRTEDHAHVTRLPDMRTESKSSKDMDQSKNSLQHQQIPHLNSESPSPPISNSHVPFGRGLSLRQRVHQERNRNSLPNESMERFAQQIDWPADSDTNEIDFKLRQVDERRLSQMSGTSTVVEAVVLDAPPQRRQTLRHTGKTSSLRTASSPTNGSKRNSLISNDSKPRLVHRNIKLSERGNRFSLTSESAASTGSDPVVPQFHKVLVAPVPPQRSVLKSSSRNPKRHSGDPTQPKIHRESTRPSTAPDGSSGYFDHPPLNLRRILHHEALATPSKPPKDLTPDQPSAVTAGSPSFPAPTSRNGSHTTSLTSASLHTHNNEQTTLPKDSPPTLEVPARPQTPVEGGERSHGEDWTGSRHRSTLTTPFSMLSMNSSTPGTLEVNEATAVNIYSHNNRSVLVVQQAARPTGELPTISTVFVDEPNTIPVISEQASREYLPIQLFDSPLINPRPPPQPPAFKVIPPTPANLTPTATKEPQLEEGGSVSINGTRFAMVRRALSARRYSESFVSPLRKSLQRGTTVSIRRSSSDKDPDNKLSPFWRPRGFWDDFSDSESDFGNDGFLVNNSLGLPQKRTISRSASLKQRLGSLRLKRRGQTERQRVLSRRSSNDSIHSYHFIQKEKKNGIVPRLGYQVQFVGLSGLQDKFERRKVRREEDRRERERVRLRKSIGPVILQSSVRSMY